ncbi:cytochrome P450 [Aureibacter tunicatorum]|uniref:Cytochrome P450 n=1 Tax=Aureibacter tunicatorum TaxID=866807 RepID=A0AAE3XK28_9BACT|nr:cytochrome P450 [Aureibacter tunicatorum]MDR6237226.1 cytochrome P450 [Aureibacter tunicatorum]BDD06218.1 cytochrome P450 [Aureibacter tunicatorum]
MEVNKTGDEPYKHWLFGHTLEFAKNTIEFINKCQQISEECYKARIAFRDFYFVFDPLMVKHVLQERQKNYKKSFAYEGLKDFLGEGLLTNEGDFWLKQRRLIQPAFHQGELDKFVVDMNQRSKGLMESWKSSDSLDITEEMIVLTEEIITHALFGGETTAMDIAPGEIGDLLLTLRSHAAGKVKNPLKMPLWVPNHENRNFKKALSRIDEIISHIIDKKLSNEKCSNDLLSMLMSVEDADTGEKMSRRQLRDEVVTLYIAGQETTTMAITFICYLLAKHPEAQSKAREEVVEVIGGRSIESMNDLRSLPYLTAIIKEGLRLYPPAWSLGREALEDDHFNDIKINKGDTLLVSIFHLHRNSKYWEDPDEFKPERFFSEIPKKAYMPFGIGQRICIGNNFSMMEIQIIIANILLKFNIDAVDQDLELKTPIILNPKNKIMLTISENEDIYA